MSSVGEAKDKTKDKTKASSLTYPFADIPAPGEAFEVAPGVYWLRMPMPIALDHINLWLLQDGDGWVIVDTGLNVPNIIAAWETLFTTFLKDAQINRIVVTHMHPDHLGLAGWLQDKTGAPLYITRTEYLMARTLVSDMPQKPPQAALDFYRAAGFTADNLAHYQKRFGMFGMAMHKMPDQYHRLQDGDSLTIGGSTWRVIIGTGHSPEHACLYNAEKKLFISGDQILPKITSIVSVYPTEPDANPLQDWLSSCAHLQDAFPNDVLVLPAHNTPFYGAHARLQALINGHEANNRRLLKLLTDPKRAVDVFPPLFKRKIDDSTLLMATGEALAHLHCLRARGQVAVTRDDHGVDWWQVTP